jgi:hypothetical protein
MHVHTYGLRVSVNTLLRHPVVSSIMYSCCVRQHVNISRRPGFASRSVHVGFVVDKVALRQVSLLVLRFSPVSIIALGAPYSLMYHLGNGQWTRLRPQFHRNIASPHRNNKNKHAYVSLAPFSFYGSEYVSWKYVFQIHFKCYKLNILLVVMWRNVYGLEDKFDYTLFLRNSVSGFTVLRIVLYLLIMWVKMNIFFRSFFSLT